jgi:hypothetical protein
MSTDRLVRAFVAEHGLFTLVAEAVGVAAAAVLAIYATAEAVHYAGWNPFEAAPVEIAGERP